ncbi:MAG: DUF488 family protein [Bacteroidota bacterium]
MFYRRKVILALLQIFDGELDKIRFQKLLFLFAQRQAKAVYDFIPYKFGCYSYSANADMNVLASRGMLYETPTCFKLVMSNTVSKANKTDYLKQLKPVDRKILLEIKSACGNMSATALMKHTYVNFPFYAIKSEAVEKILSRKELENINIIKPKSNEPVLFTIGYEGITLEEYLVRLIKHDVKVLVDVRNNPVSMKFGFSKNHLKRYCESLGINYVHIPEVGIQSDQRQELNTQADYDKLFILYCRNNLKKTKIEQKKILNLLIVYERIALACFEADISKCHRKHLAEAIKELPGDTFKVKHI